jgi:imidazolonepropionase-like amidohydrolase
MRRIRALVSEVIVTLCLLAISVGVQAQGSPFAAKKIKQPDSLLVVHAGRLLAVPGQPVLEEQTVVIRNGRVNEILSGFADPDSFEKTEKTQFTVVDLRKFFVLPGLMDAHVHLAVATGSFQRGMLQINASPGVGESAVNAVINARLNLAAGFTAVRDLGSDQESVFAVRDAVNLGLLIGPTILASGVPVSVTAGAGYNAKTQSPDDRAAAGVCDGPDDCRKLVRYLEKTGSDLIKFYATGGFSSNTGIMQHMSMGEMRAIVAAAKLRGIPVTTHAYAADAIIDALNAGVGSIEHAFLLDDRGIKMMRKNGVYLVPTLTVAEPPSMVKRFLGGRKPISVVLRDEQQAFEKAYKAGVKIAFGTDAGIYPHGENADEFLTMVDLGMTPEDAIITATINNAGLFGVDGLTGTIEVDSVADIIAVADSPLENIAALTDVPYVIKSGRLVKQAGNMIPPLDYDLPQRY